MEQPGHRAGRCRGSPQDDDRGISGDSLVSDLPTIVGDLQWIDTAWTTLRQQIDQDCG